MMRRSFLRLEPNGDLIKAVEHLPDLQEGQLYMRVVAAGVCSTDVLLVDARRKGVDVPPSLSDAGQCNSLGHEVIVQSLGAPGAAEDFFAVIPAERRSSGAYGCMGLSETSHGGWGSMCIVEDWALIAIPYYAPRFILADSFAPGFGLARQLQETEGRIVVVGLGALGLGTLWGLSLSGRDQLVGVDPNMQRIGIAARTVQRCEFRQTAEIERGDTVICASSTGSLSRSSLADWLRKAERVYCLTHPDWPLDAVRSLAGDDTPIWLHSPPTDHAAAIDALVGFSAADSFVETVSFQNVANAGRVSNRSSALRIAMTFWEM